MGVLGGFQAPQTPKPPHIALEPKRISRHPYMAWKYSLCSFQRTQDHWNIHQTPGDIPVWSCGSLFINIRCKMTHGPQFVKNLKTGFILDPEVFFHQIFGSWCGFEYNFSPVIQILNPEHVPTCPHGHFSVKYSIYNRIFNVFQWPPHLKNSYSWSNCTQ